MGDRVAQRIDENVSEEMREKGFSWNPAALSLFVCSQERWFVPVIAHSLIKRHRWAQKRERIKEILLSRSRGVAWAKRRSSKQSRIVGSSNWHELAR